MDRYAYGQPVDAGREWKGVQEHQRIRERVLFPTRGPRMPCGSVSAPLAPGKLAASCGGVLSSAWRPGPGGRAEDAPSLARGRPEYGGVGPSTCGSAPVAPGRPARVPGSTWSHAPLERSGVGALAQEGLGGGGDRPAGQPRWVGPVLLPPPLPGWSGGVAPPRLAPP